MIWIFTISLSLTLFYVLLLTHYARLWDKIQPFESAQEMPSVSIVIAFRNEIDSLPNLLNSLQNLNTEKAEVKLYFINDHSTDDSVKCIKEFSLKFPYDIIHLKETFGKKAAIQKAWELVDSQVIIHTDADCILSPNWLNEMVKPFGNEDIQFVSGPVRYVLEHRFFFKLLQLDFASLIAIGAAHIQWGKPMICNGANLAYRKTAMQSIQLNEKYSSGDDVFLMQSISSSFPNSIAFVKHQDAIVNSEPPSTLKSALHQRMRWASKNTAYSSRTNTSILALTWFFNVLILFNLLCISRIGVVLALFMVVLKMYVEINLYNKISPFFAIRNWIPYNFVGQIIHIPYMAMVPIISKLFKYKWKGRKLR